MEFHGEILENSVQLCDFSVVLCVTIRFKGRKQCTS